MILTAEQNFVLDFSTYGLAGHVSLKGISLRMLGGKTATTKKQQQKTSKQTNKQQEEEERIKAIQKVFYLFVYFIL